MNAEVTTAVEYGTERPCQIARIVYEQGVHSYVALAFRYLDAPQPQSWPWTLTWLGFEGGDSAQLPPGIFPSAEMLEAIYTDIEVGPPTNRRD